MIAIRALASLAFALPALAHFAMLQPAPLPSASGKSPLEPSGSNFPCQGADLSNVGERTALTAGSSSPLVFNVGSSGENTAVHGGGSCQVSITYETDPAKQKLPSSWKVLHSFVEGCPSNAPGNLGYSKLCDSNGGADCVNSFSFEVPKEVKSGNAILAWTWFNTVGNREMYMNCAAVTVKGGNNQLSSLPDLFVANIGSVSGGCATKEGVNVDFPNPGKYVTRQKALSGSGPFPVAVPDTCGSGSGSGDAGSSPAPVEPAPVKPTPTKAPTVTAPPKNTGGAFIETPEPTSTSAGTGTAAPTNAVPVPEPVAPAPEPVTPKPVTPKPVTPKPVTPKPVTPKPVIPGNCRADQIACPVDGFFCISASQFGLCAHGCAYPQAVALGTKCEDQSIRHARAIRFPPQARRSLA